MKSSSCMVKSSTFSWVISWIGMSWHKQFFRIHPFSLTQGVINCVSGINKGRSKSGVQWMPYGIIGSYRKWLFPQTGKIAWLRDLFPILVLFRHRHTNCKCADFYICRCRVACFVTSCVVKALTWDIPLSNRTNSAIQILYHIKSVSLSLQRCNPHIPWTLSLIFPFWW